MNDRECLSSNILHVGHMTHNIFGILGKFLLYFRQRRELNKNKLNSIRQKFPYLNQIYILGNNYHTLVITNSLSHELKSWNHVFKIWFHNFNWNWILKTIFQKEVWMLCNRKCVIKYSKSNVLYSWCYSSTNLSIIGHKLLLYFKTY